MDVIQQLRDIFKTYQDNSELISVAVKSIGKVGKDGEVALRRGLEERRRKLILKAVALLAPSDIPAKVVEVDGVDDAELLLCQDKGWLDSALAVYLRTDAVSDAVGVVCAKDLGEGLGFYTTSALAAVWDHVELGQEGLVELVKPNLYACDPSGRKYLENARNFSKTAFQLSPEDTTSLKVLAFEASRDDHRRFLVLTAVLVETRTGKVIYYDNGTTTTSDVYTLDSETLTGLEFQIPPSTVQMEAHQWPTVLSVLCSMFAELHSLPEGNNCKLVNSMLTRLTWGFKSCVERLEAIKKANSSSLIPSKQDLKLIHNKNDESARSRFRRQFDVRASLVEGVRNSHSNEPSGFPEGKYWLLKCMANNEIISLGKRLVNAYTEQKILPAQLREAGSASVFATFIYRSLGRAVVAEEYRQIFSSSKVNICRAKSGTQVFVPHSEMVTMTTYGMDTKPIEVINSQIFSYESGDRFALLPHLLSILGLREEDALLSIIHREMDENPYLVSDPMTADIRGFMLQSFETKQRTFRVSTLHEDARQAVGSENYAGLVREAISLLARLGAAVPAEYISRSCFYDVTRDVKGYRDISALCHILFDRGVTLEGLGCELLVNGNEAFIANIMIEAPSQNSHVIARINRSSVRRKPRDEDDEFIRGLTAAIEGRGLVLMRPEFDIHGEIHLAVTRSDPGRGILAHFVNCEAR